MKHTLRLIWLTLAAPALLGAPALSASPAPAAELIQAVAALRGIASLRADFTQSDSNGGRATGVISLKRPGKLRFQYAPGNPMVIIADGHALIMVDTEARQIQRWPIGSSPLGALLDPSRDVTRFGSVVPGGPAFVSIAVRDSTHPEYGVITLTFTHKASAPGGLELAGWTTVDSQSRRTVIRLTNLRYGVALDEALFRYSNTLAGPHH